MEISSTELRALARDVDDRQHDAMRTFTEETRELHRDVGRRRFLGSAATSAVVGGTALALGSAWLPNGFLSAAGAQAITDEDLAAFAQSVELAAVAAYGMAAPALSDATKPVATLFAQHHQAHAAAFGALAGAKAQTAPNAKLVTALTPALQAVKDETGALTLAFQLENQAAETYAFGLTVATGIPAASGMATILPIEQEHAAVLAIALGKGPADVFINGAFVAAAVGDGTDIKKGIDPTVFPVG